MKVFTGDRDPRVSAKTQREWVKDCLAACAEAAEAHGVTVVAENHSSICFTPAELLDLVGEIGSDACKVCLDAYNCAKFTGGEAVYEAAEALAG